MTESHRSASDQTRAWRWLAHLALILLPVAIYAVLGFERRWMSDDGFINLRVVRNLLDGYGPVFNAGERVEAFTSPLWVGVLALLGLSRLRLELVAVYAGLALSVGGLSLACLACAWAQARGRPSRHRLATLWLVPAGAGVFAVLPPAWDYATSGLEGGLDLFWLGLSSFLLVRLAVDRRAGRSGPGGSWRRLSTAFVLGLGPLVRPDLALFSAATLTVLLWAQWRRRPARRWRRSLALMAAAGGLPVAYQVFRMGYYAALVPNTALAKEAFASNWSQGLAYLQNTYALYGLGVPLAALGPLWWRGLRRAGATGHHMLRHIGVAFVAGGLANTVYVVKVGGDFMHGRLLLPGLFGLLVPVMAVGLPRAAPRWERRMVRGLMTVLVAWMLICGLALRVDPENVAGIGDERGWYARMSGVDNPVRLEDFRHHDFSILTEMLVGVARRHCPSGDRRSVDCVRVLALDEAGETVLTPYRAIYPARKESDAIGRGAVIIGARRAIGIVGYTTGRLAHIVDRHGLADPIASRMALRERTRPGHDKVFQDDWVVARFAAPRPHNQDRRVAVARQALACGDLAEVRRATQDPLTASRFLRNLVLAFRLHSLRVPVDPWEARDRFCGPSVDTLHLVGGLGGSMFESICPSGRTLTGVIATRHSKWKILTALEPGCGGHSPGSLRPAQMADHEPVEPTAETVTTSCEEGASAIGVDVVSGRFVADLKLVCGQPDDPRLPLAWLGHRAASSGGWPTTRLLCEQGAVLTGLIGRSGALIDAIGIACRPR